MQYNNYTGQKIYIFFILDIFNLFILIFILLFVSVLMHKNILVLDTQIFRFT